MSFETKQQVGRAKKEKMINIWRILIKDHDRTKHVDHYVTNTKNSQTGSWINEEAKYFMFVVKCNRNDVKRIILRHICNTRHIPIGLGI